MVGWVQDLFNLTSREQAKVIVTLAWLVFLTVARWVVLGVVHRRIEDATIWYRTRKTVSYVITIVGLLVVVRLWLEGSGLTTYFGLVSAGLAIALSDVLKNLAGWMYILVRRPFRLGDRIEIGGNAGDVVDIRAFRFTILEIRNWVDADQSTGRIMHIPNGLVFTNPVANFTEGFEYLWHEVPVLVTFESDWELTERIVLESITEVSPDMSTTRAGKMLREAARQYQIKYTHLTPTTYLTVRDSGVLITGRLLVEARRRRGIESSVWKAILRKIEAEPSIELAYPTVRTFFPDSLRVSREGAAPAAES